MSRFINEQPRLSSNNRAGSLLRLCPWFALLWWVVAVSMLYRQQPINDTPTHTPPMEQVLQHDATVKMESETFALTERVLYIVSSMAEFDGGHRNTIKGRDRFQEILIPVVVEACSSMRARGYLVDIYLITHYKLRPERLKLLRDRISSDVGIEIWDDATPLGYNLQHGEAPIEPITRALSRQHRYVIKDKFLHYNLFVAFEDDMLIKGDHVHYYEEITNYLGHLKSEAPARKLDSTVEPIDRFYGQLSKIQLARLVPGLIRVEVVDMNRAEFQIGRAQSLSVLPHAPNVNTTALDPYPCCLLLNGTAYTTRVMASIENIYLWETQALALGIHKMPDTAGFRFLDWVVLQRGVEQEFIPRDKVLGEYWVGQNAKPPVPRPNVGAPQYINNQGGWMGTRKQILAWHRSYCRGLFLPPYDDHDGLKNNVEFWSGGLNLAGMNACQLQRIVSLEPSGFSKQLVYHFANNKQKSNNLVFTNVQDFWQQLHSAQLLAEAAIPAKT
jgi:hypothetical protein